MKKIRNCKIVLILLSLISITKLKAQTHTIHDTVYFSTYHQSLWGPGGPVLNIDTIIPLIDFHQNFGPYTMPMGTGTNFVYGANINVDLDFEITGFTLGWVDVDYPVVIDLTFPNDYTFHQGDWVTIKSNWDTIPGYDMDAQFPKFGVIALTLDMGLNIDADIVIDIMGFQDTIPIFDYHFHNDNFDTLFYLDSSGYLVYPCSNSPNPVWGTFGFCTSQLLPFTFNSQSLGFGGLTGWITIPYVDTYDYIDLNKCLQARGDCTWVGLNIDLIEVVANLVYYLVPPPNGQIISDILHNLSGSFNLQQNFGGFIYVDVDIDYVLLSMNVTMTSTMQQDVEFCPTIWTTLTFPTAVDWYVTDPATGDTVIFDHPLIPNDPALGMRNSDTAFFAAGYDLHFRYPCYGYPTWTMGIRHWISSGFRHHIWDSVAIDFNITVFDIDIDIEVWADIFVTNILILDEQFSIGPLFQDTIPLFWFPISWFDRSWNLPGFNDSIFPPHTIKPLPAFNFTANINNVATCYGDSTGSIHITYNNGVPPFIITYEWSGNTVTHHTNLTHDSLTNVPADTFYITIIDSNLCTLDTTVILINLNPPLSIYLDTIDVACHGESTGQLIAHVSGGVPPYTYTWAPINSNDSILSNVPTGTYYVTVTDAIGCTIVDTGFVDQPDEPLTAYVSNTVNILCHGFSTGEIYVVTSGGTPPYSYLWSSGHTTEDIVGVPAGNYTLTITDANSCKYTVTATLTQPDPIVINISDVTICYGATTTVTIQSVTGGVPPYQYNWSTGGIGTSIVVSPLNTTVYTVTVTDNNQCTATEDVTVTVLQPLQVDLWGSADSICIGSPLTINGNITGGYGPPYVVSFYDINIPNYVVISTTLPATIYPTYSTTYVGIVQDLCNLTGVGDSVKVTVMPKPPISFIANPLKGCQPLTVQFSEISPDEGQTYHWNFGDGHTASGKNVTHTYTNYGTFDITLTVTSWFGCDTTRVYNDTITIYQKPHADFTISPDTLYPPDLLNPVYEFYNTSYLNTYNYWTFGDGTYSYSENTIHQFPDTGYYYVTLYVTSDKGCKDTITKRIYIREIITFYIPNAFTPDNDDANDVFKPVGREWDPQKYEFYIYNRWGELVFETHDINEGWNGMRKNNEPAPVGVYVWHIHWYDKLGYEHTHVGYVLLLRQEIK